MFLRIKVELLYIMTAITATEYLVSTMDLPVPPLCSKNILFFWYPVPTISNQEKELHKGAGLPACCPAGSRVSLLTDMCATGKTTGSNAARNDSQNMLNEKKINV